MAVDPYHVGLVLVGLAVVGVALLPRVLSEWPLSIPIIFVGFGAAVFSLPTGLPPPDPLEYSDLAEKLAELGVIVALTSAGLKLDRPLGLRRWATTWRLLAITMPLTIAAAALLGWVVGLAIPTAALLGAVVAPTDPVLASEVQVEEPLEGTEDEPLSDEEGRRGEVPFALTSEAGLNDGLAFPFTYLAVLLATEGVAPENWVVEWASYYVLYKIGVGVLVGAALGWLLARLVFATDVGGELSRAVHGLEALGATLLLYGVAELVEGYGFLAVFVGALAFRHVERTHDYQQRLHAVAEKGEHVLMVIIMLFFGGAVVAGLLSPLSPADAAVAAVLVLVVRPLAGLAGLIGFERDPRERGVIAFFGIRGIGSFFYLAYGLNEASFPGAERLWAIVGLVVLLSVVIHGLTATPAVDRLTRSET